MTRGCDQSERPLTVLLISPVAAWDVHSGDVTYTAELLASPPPGVRYVTYDEALGAGTLIELGRWRGPSGPPRTASTVGLATTAKVEAVVRRSGLAFRESVRHFQVTPGAFDLIHAHVFHTRFHGPHPPVVSSAGAPLAWLYRDAWGWGPTRLRLASAIDAAVARTSGASMCASAAGQARRFIAPSRHLRDWLVGSGWSADSVDIVPNYCQPPAVVPTPVRSPVSTIGFVAKDFDAKGGGLVLQAHARLRARHPGLRLVIVGSTPRLTPAELAASDITWTPVVPRQTLLDEVLPSLDILAHPSGVDALPYSVMEALARGIPALVSNYTSLPELVEGGAGLAVPRSVEAVASGLEELLSPEVWAEASRAAIVQFGRRFSSRTQAPALGRSYRTALESNDRR